jgi:hypothetical protein
MEACYGGTNVMERFCAVARGIDINKGMCLCPLGDGMAVIIHNTNFIPAG